MAYPLDSRARWSAMKGARSVLPPLILAALVTACGGGAAVNDAASAEAENTSEQSTDQTLRESEIPTFTNAGEALVGVAKRIMGVKLNDDGYEWPEYFGLIHLANDLGFAFAWNWCDGYWKSDPQKNGDVWITSNHNTGSGWGCTEGGKRDRAVTYRFKNWNIKQLDTQPTKFDDIELDRSKGQFQIEGDLLVAKDLNMTVMTHRIINRSDKEVNVPEFGKSYSVTDSTTLTQGWTNTSSRSFTIKNSWNASFFGVGASVEVEVSTSSSKEESESNESSTEENQTLSCKIEVPSLGQGCWTLRQVVSRKRSRAKFLARVEAKPQEVQFDGFLRRGQEDDPGCWHRNYRDLNRGRCSSKDPDVIATFGTSSRTFIDDIRERRYSDSDNIWLWGAMSSVQDYMVPYQPGGTVNGDGRVGSGSSGKAIPRVDAVIEELGGNAKHLDSDQRKNKSLGNGVYVFALPFTVDNVMHFDCVTEIKEEPIGVCDGDPNVKDISGP